MTDQKGANGACLVCASTKVEEFLDLGSTALANKFLTVLLGLVV